MPRPHAPRPHRRPTLPRRRRIFKARGVDADVKTGLSKDELIKIIGDYDGLAVRSATKADKDVIAAANNLKVIGRAGIGVDNVDIPAATAAGMVVMNTPFGNSITTAEHAIAMMFALARELPQADLLTHHGEHHGDVVLGGGDGVTERDAHHHDAGGGGRGSRRCRHRSRRPITFSFLASATSLCSAWWRTGRRGHRNGR